MRLQNTIVAAVLALASAPAFSAACAGFSDVDSANTTYCSAVTYLEDKGITLGCGDGSNYCPNDYVTRLQMALFLQRMGKGGAGNDLLDNFSAIGGGTSNTVLNQYAFDVIGGGYENFTSGQYASIGGGRSNTAKGAYGTIPGGVSNSANGATSFAAGEGALANFDGQFVWSDGNSFYFTPGHGYGWGGDGTNTFNVRATGGVWLVTGINGSGVPDAGVYVNPGSGTWASTSDRAVKEHFSAIDPGDVLAKVSAMPIRSWNYIAEGKNVRHLGPVSQDFYAAFALGPDDKSITTVDEGGIALAAIQGLNAKIEQKDARIAALEHAMAQMQARMDALAH